MLGAASQDSRILRVLEACGHRRCYLKEDLMV
jgi:hypothetical protein